MRVQGTVRDLNSRDLVSFGQLRFKTWIKKC